MRLIDEFGPIDCEYLLARLDAFFVSIQDSSASQGYAVIDVGDADLSSGLRFEQWISGNVKVRKFPQDRIKIVRTKTDGDFKIQFWLAPNSVVKPEISEKKWNFSFEKGLKPFIFATNDDDFGVCPGAEYLGLNHFAEYMKANPKARGNIVIKTPSYRTFVKEKQDLLRLIVEKYEISSRRLRFFRVSKKNLRIPEFSEVEVWILP